MHHTENRYSARNGYEEQVSLSDLFNDLSQEASLLVRQEVQLAKTELTKKGKRISKDAAFLIAGLVVGHIAVLVFISMLVLALTNFMPAWVSALIVTLVLAGVAGGMIYKGWSDLQKVDPAPEKTVRSLQADKQWLQRQVMNDNT